VLAEGTLLDGKYEIRGQLATGGMGEVYLAHRTMLGDDVAVKLIRPSGPDPAVWRARFLRESRACAQLRHPNIVTILDYNADDPDRPYLVMEYLNGPSLAEELRARGKFDLAEGKRIASFYPMLIVHSVTAPLSLILITPPVEFCAITTSTCHAWPGS